jgi:hypothetical protein
MDLFYYKEYEEKITRMYKSKYLRKIELRDNKVKENPNKEKVQSRYTIPFSKYIVSTTKVYPTCHSSNRDLPIYKNLG